MYLIDEIRNQQEATYKAYTTNNTDKRAKSTKAFYSTTRHTLYGFITYLVCNAEGRAKNKSLQFNISAYFILQLYKKQHGKCAISGIPLTRIIGKTTRINPYNISIDRINSSKGYTKDNVQLVCAFVNVMKMEYSTSQLIDWCRIITTNNA